MKTLKSYAEEKGFNCGEVVGEWEVPSKSGGSPHPVRLFENGSYDCDCVAYAMSGQPKNCKHIDQLKLWQK